MNPQPPKWADRLLNWYCRQDRIEDLQGDLYEYFDRNCQRRGVRAARLIYMIDVLKFFRIYTIKKLKIKGLMNFIELFNNYWKTSVRSIARNRLFSSINVIGLAISMSVGVVMIVFISELLSYDNFHAKKDRIYRVISSFEGVYNQGDPSNLASTSPWIGKKMQEFSGIEHLALMRRNLSGDFKAGDKILPLRGLWAENGFFDIFSFELVRGNPSHLLDEPNTAVITSSTAEKLFGEKDPINQVISRNGEEDFIITGIVADPPRNSHIQFEILTSYPTLELTKMKESAEDYLDPANMWMYYVYMVLNEGTSPEDIQAYLEELAGRENAQSESVIIGFELQKLSGIVPGRELSNKIGPGMSYDIIYILAGLTFIVLLSACFNYTNLSIARSLRRTKEVGVRKIVGAGRRQVFAQFTMEAVIISFLALLIGVGLFYVIRPEFLEMIQNKASMNLRPVHFALFLVFTVFVGILAGFMPSAFLSRIPALLALKNPSQSKKRGGFNLRRVLIVFQFTLSIAFIIATTISYRQYRFALNFDLGYNTENILNVPLRGNDHDVMATALESVPGVEMISKSAFVLSSGDIWGGILKGDDPLDSISVHLNYIDEKFIGLHDFELIAGQSLPALNDETNATHIVVNEMVLKRFQLGEPNEAIGKTLDLNGKNKVIVGVIRDFQHGRVEDKRHEFIFVQRPDNFDYLNLKIQTADVVQLMDNLESQWSEIDNVHPFQAEFFDETLKDAYAEFLHFFKIIAFLAALAISISTLGLLGIAVYTAESRLKEISVRKVLGATEQNLIILMSRGFFGMILIAGVIAIPLTYLLFDHLILAEMANRIPIGVLDLSPGLLVTLTIAMLTIGWQAFAVARTNPSSTLRDE